MARIKVGTGEIQPGQQWVAGRYMLQFTEAGNLELWNRVARQLLWQSGSKSLRVSRLAMQEDGNLVIYDRDGMALWSSGTYGHPDAYLAVRDDGNLVICLRDNRPIWSATLPVARKPISQGARA